MEQGRKARCCWATNRGVRRTSLTWENLMAILPGSGGWATKKFLQRVYGYAVPGRVVAIMGPFGSGKSTLLDFLSVSRKEAGEKCALDREGAVLNVKKRLLDDSVVKHIDCYTFTVEEFKYIIAKYKVSSMVLAPEEKLTHWHQTILYFSDPIEVKQDQVIEVSVNVSQSKENPHALNIHQECLRSNLGERFCNALNWFCTLAGHDPPTSSRDILSLAGGPLSATTNGIPLSLTLMTSFLYVLVVVSQLLEHHP